MNADVRHHLWSSWGLCPRHSWAHALVEIEAWGGWTFSTSILYEDLLGRALRSIRRYRFLPRDLGVRALSPKGACHTCDYVLAAKLEWRDHSSRIIDRVNRFERSRELLCASRSQWQEHCCPSCGDGKGPVCRPHLLARSASMQWTELATILAPIHIRLGRYIDSMTWNGPKASDLERVSWIEALGWFAGWELPMRLCGAP